MEPLRCIEPREQQPQGPMRMSPRPFEKIDLKGLPDMLGPMSQYDDQKHLVRLLVPWSVQRIDKLSRPWYLFSFFHNFSSIMAGYHRHCGSLFNWSEVHINHPSAYGRNASRSAAGIGVAAKRPPSRRMNATCCSPRATNSSLSPWKRTYSKFMVSRFCTSAARRIR